MGGWNVECCVIVHYEYDYTLTDYNFIMRTSGVVCAN
jgi:hypothetical protein